MRQAGGDLAQRGHLLLLILELGEIADAVGEQGHQARAQHRYAAEHIREAIDGEAGDAHLGDGACSGREMGHAGVRQHACNGRSADDAGDGIGIAGFDAQAHVPFQENDHAVGGAAAADEGFTGSELRGGHLRGQPLQVVGGEVGEDGYHAEVFG